MSQATIAAPAPSRSGPAYYGWLQASLNRTNSAGLSIDGKFGPRTRSALQAFQRRAGLRPDGIPGEQTERALVSAGASPPPAGAGPSKSPPGPAPAPGGVRVDPNPPAGTLYVSIPLGGESPARPLTGIYVPPGYRAGSSVDLVVYLHGFHEWRPALAIDGHWDARALPHFALREAASAARKNILLVAPTLGPRSQAGWLARPEGLDTYLSRVLPVLHAHGPHRGLARPPRLGRLVLACHSGGGRPMRFAATTARAAAPHLRECWGFDCLYNGDDAEAWARWAAARPDARLFIHYLSSTRKLSEGLADRQLPNVVVGRSTARGHNWVPLEHLGARLRAAAFFDPI